MRHEFGDLDYFAQDGTRVERPANARRLPDFDLVDQQGNSVTRASLSDSFWLVAFMTTDTASTPYLTQLTQQLLWANWRYRDEPDVGLLCISLDTEHDTPERLLNYVSRNERYNRYPDKWRFLTGEQSQIDSLITLDLGVDRDPNDPYNIATLLLIDDQGYVRQKYLASSEHEMGEAVEDIALLKKRKLEGLKKQSLLEAAPPLPLFGPRDWMPSGDGESEPSTTPCPNLP